MKPIAINIPSFSIVPSKYSKEPGLLGEVVDLSLE